MRKNARKCTFLALECARHLGGSRARHTCAGDLLSCWVDVLLSIGHPHQVWALGTPWAMSAMPNTAGNLAEKSKKNRTRKRTQSGGHGNCQLGARVSVGHRGQREQKGSYLAQTPLGTMPKAGRVPFGSRPRAARALAKLPRPRAPKKVPFWGSKKHEKSRKFRPSLMQSAPHKWECAENWGNMRGGGCRREITGHVEPFRSIPSAMDWPGRIFWYTTRFQGKFSKKIPKNGEKSHNSKKNPPGRENDALEPLQVAWSNIGDPFGMPNHWGLGGHPTGRWVRYMKVGTWGQKKRKKMTKK